jgi:hypothetical protein
MLQSGIAGYTMACDECGITFDVKKGKHNVRYCSKCRPIVAKRIRVEWDSSNPRRKRNNSKRGIEYQKPLPESHPDCHWRMYCLFRREDHLKKHGCKGCIRYQPVALDILDHIGASDVWDTAEVVA